MFSSLAAPSLPTLRLLSPSPTSCFPSFFLPLTVCRLDYFSPDAAVCNFPRLNLPGFVVLISLSPFCVISALIPLLRILQGLY